MIPNHIQAQVVIAVAALALLAASPRAARAAPMGVSEGVVSAVGAYSVTVADPRDTTLRVFALNQLRTKVTRDGNPARFGDLRPGDGVTIWFRPIGDKLHAERIRAVSQPPVPADLP